MKNRIIPFLMTTGYMMMAGSANAVVLQDMYTILDGGTSTDLGEGAVAFEIDVAGAGFSAAGHGKLVMTYGGHDANVAGDPLVTRVLYNGVELTEAVQDLDNGSMVTTGIFYLDNVASDGILRIETTNTTAHYGVGLYALDGLKPGVQDVGSARSNAQVSAGDHVVTLTTSEGFFVQEFARNNQSVSEDTGDAYQTLYNYSADSYRGFSQYLVTDAAGDYAAPVGNTGDNFKRIVTAGFEAGVIPEPGSTALVALAGLGFLARRRR